MAYSFHPVNHTDTIDLANKQRENLWFVPEVDCSNDRAQFEKLNPSEQKLIKGVLAFFANFDGLVNENISHNLEERVSSAVDENGNCFKEAGVLYNAIKFIEDIHNEMYSILAKTYITNREELEGILNSITEYESVGAIVEWMRSFNEGDLLETLVMQICIEGVLFTSAFAVVYWFKKKNVLPGLCQANELIARDETLHTIAGIHIFDKFANGEMKPVGRSLRLSISRSRISEIISEAVNLAEGFINEFLEEGAEITPKELLDYTKVTANNIAVKLGAPEVFEGVVNPFRWMLAIGMPTLGNFFEKRNTEYSTVIDSRSFSGIYDGDCGDF